MSSPRVSSAPNRKAAEGVCEVDYVDERALAAAQKALPELDELRQMADAFKVIANPSRLALLIGLREQELCVCDCAQLIGLSLPATSQHLKQLRQLGAVTFRQDHKLAYYRIADERWVALLSVFNDQRKLST